MNDVSKGEAWKLGLLSGELKPTDATDQLLDNMVSMSNQQMLAVMQPMAELRADQIDRGLASDEEHTRKEAERMAARYSRDAGESRNIQDAHRDAEALGDDVSPTAKQVLGNWLGKILENDLIGEMEKELSRTVDTYKREKEEHKLTLRHRTNGVAI